MAFLRFFNTVPSELRITWRKAILGSTWGAAGNSVFWVAVKLAWLWFLAPMAFAVEQVTTKWGGDALLTYETGFAYQVMRDPKSGIGLFDMELIENDSPGAGGSEKGVSTDSIWGKRRARKVLRLEDPRSAKAWLVLQVAGRGAFPLRFSINGQQAEFAGSTPGQSTEAWQWREFPPQWLKAGDNSIELFCPGAEVAEQGWMMQLARADEFEAGGGDPSNVGRTSFTSKDAGKTWQEGRFGPALDAAEYSIRISLDRHLSSGWLATPVIDLWRGDSEDLIVPQREIRTLRVQANAEIPKGCQVQYFLRRGTNPNPQAPGWRDYELIGQGPLLDHQKSNAAVNWRYAQIKALLTTADPRLSPTVRSLQVSATLDQLTPRHENIRIVRVENPPVRYSSLEWEWEKSDRPELLKLREMENLDELTAGSRTQLEAQVRLMDHVTKRWTHTNALPEYAGWDGLSILERINKQGAGGMCIQFNNLLASLCLSFGWQARLVNIVAHEVCEVWNDDYGKWIFLDADNQNTYNYSPKTAEPLDLLEIHRLYLDYYFPNRAIDWTKDTIEWMDIYPDRPAPIRRGSLTHHQLNAPFYKSPRVISGFVSAAFMRLIPRNNWFEKPFPRPLNHGMSSWPWNGYVNWYDERTPRKRQYNRYSDRPQDLWPALNSVHVDAVEGFGNDRLFLQFETYTPNFSHFEVELEDTGWRKVPGNWTWLLQSGRNVLRVRSVNRLGVRGKPSVIVLNHARAPLL